MSKLYCKIFNVETQHSLVFFHTGGEYSVSESLANFIMYSHLGMSKLQSNLYKSSSKLAILIQGFQGFFVTYKRVQITLALLFSQFIMQCIKCQT